LNLTPKSNGQISRSDSVSSYAKYLVQGFRVTLPECPTTC
jgi:hypothetical protein